MSSVRILLSLFTAGLFSQSALGQGAVAYRGVTVETAGKAGRLENATLVIRDGKIEAVGVGIKPPDDARIIEARGKTIMPGIIDPYKEVAIAGSGPVEASALPTRGGRRGVVFPTRGGGGGGGFTRVVDNFYPYDPMYRVMLRSGLTDLNLVTSSYGQAAVVRVAPKDPENMLLNGEGVLFTTVTNDSASLDVIRTGLETAERAKKGETITGTAPTGQTPPGGQTRGGQGRRGGGGRRAGGAGGRGPIGGGGFNIESLKGWQAVYEGKSPLFVTATSAAAIAHLLKVVEPYKDVKLALAAPGGALYEMIDQLTGKPVKVIIRPTFSFVPNTRDRMDISKQLHQAGIEFAFTQPANQADLVAAQDVPLFSVATLVKSGLPRKVAMEALTARPAALIGLEKTHGTIEPGKTADLLIFTGDPLDAGSQLNQVLIEGRTVYEN
ncbi:hypothetical protein BH10PLA2_BH10PLA2_02780 [soil metagenome]